MDDRLCEVIFSDGIDVNFSGDIADSIEYINKFLDYTAKKVEQYDSLVAQVKGLHLASKHEVVIAVTHQDRIEEMARQDKIEEIARSCSAAGIQLEAVVPLARAMSRLGSSAQEAAIAMVAFGRQIGEINTRIAEDLNAISRR